MTTTTITTPDSHPSNVDHRSFRRQAFFNVSRVSLARSSHQESYAKMQQEDDEDCDKSSISYISNKRTVQYQQESQIYNVNEDYQISNGNYHHTSSRINPTNSEDGEELILTAAKLPTDNKLSMSSTPITNAS